MLFLDICVLHSISNSFAEPVLFQVLFFYYLATRKTTLLKFIDWGNKETVPLSALRELPQ
jgi:hypothetical protein